MDCKRARKLMDSYMDDTISRKDLKEFAEHIRNCPACHAELETDYIVSHAEEMLDNAEQDSFNIRKMVDDDLVRRERGIRRKHLLGILFWLLIILLAVIIVTICVYFVSPATMVKFLNALGDFFRIQPDWQFWKDFSITGTSAVSG